MDSAHGCSNASLNYIAFTIEFVNYSTSYAGFCPAMKARPKQTFLREPKDPKRSLKGTAANRSKQRLRTHEPHWVPYGALESVHVLRMALMGLFATGGGSAFLIQFLQLWQARLLEPLLGADAVGAPLSSLHSGRPRGIW